MFGALYWVHGFRNPPVRSRGYPEKCFSPDFLGRIDGRSPSADPETLIEREAQKMTTSEFAQAARRCGTEFSARGVEFVRIGKALERPGK